MVTCVSRVLVVLFVVMLQHTSSLRWVRLSRHVLVRPRMAAACALSSSVQNEPVDWASLQSTVVETTGNNTATLLKLINLGDRWSQRQPHRDVPFHSLGAQLGYHKVTGCMANVQLKLLPHEDKVCIAGHADSRVAQGLLAFIAQGLSQMTPSQVLALNAAHFARKLGFEKVLPVGRLNGFQNIIVLVQALLKEGSSPKLPEGIADTQLAARLGTEQPLSLATYTMPAATEQGDRSDEVAVLLSGGVDSSVALNLLIDQGHKVRAYYLKIWLEDELSWLNECPWEEDLRYASATCEQLNVPLEVVSLQREYFDHVVRYTLDEAQAGRTPNPDVMCNSMIKFGVFHDYVGKFHKKIATGHYAQVQRKQDAEGGESTLLVPGADVVKDQSFFLSNLRPAQLQQCIFPIGHMQKKDVRRYAEDHNLPAKVRKDSQGICFLGKLSFDQFIGHYLGENVGNIVDYHTNKVIGAHQGLWFHTIGQRKGVGNLVHKGISHLGPFIVVDKDLASNTLFVTNNYSRIDEPRRFFEIAQPNWIVPVPKELQGGGSMNVMVKIRHGPEFAAAVVQITADGAIAVRLAEKDPSGIAPGQFAVLYDTDCTHVFAAGSMTVCTARRHSSQFLRTHV